MSLFLITGWKCHESFNNFVSFRYFLGVGLVCCILRILFCICPSQCIMSSRRKLKKKNAKVDADHTTSLLRGDSKRVSIARGPQVLVSIKSYHSSIPNDVLMSFFLAKISTEL